MKEQLLVILSHTFILAAAITRGAILLLNEFPHSDRETSFTTLIKGP